MTVGKLIQIEAAMAKNTITLDFFNLDDVRDHLENNLIQRGYTSEFINFFKKEATDDFLTDYIDFNLGNLTSNYTYRLFDFEIQVCDLVRFEFKSSYIKELFKDNEKELSRFTSINDEYCYITAPRICLNFAPLIKDLKNRFNKKK